MHKEHRFENGCCRINLSILFLSTRSVFSFWHSFITFFFLPFDLMLAPFVKKLEALYEWKPGMSCMQPYSPVAVFKAILYAKLNKNVSNRELERHLLRKSHMAGALGFDKVPSYQTFTHFKRECLTIEFLEEIFNVLRDYLVDLGAIDFSSVTIDSAPTLPL